jgi:CBS domain-containing protein
MVTVRELLRTKPSELWTVSPNATVFQALERLAAQDIGALPVVEGSRLVGIFSERDYARKVVLKGRASRDMLVADVMVRAVVCVSWANTIQDCMALMTEQRVRHLPVLEGERLVGIVTIGDVVKQIITEQNHTIEQLEQYIRGSY